MEGRNTKSLKHQKFKLPYLRQSNDFDQKDMPRLGSLPALRIYKCQECGVRLTESVEAKERRYSFRNSSGSLAIAAIRRAITQVQLQAMELPAKIGGDLFSFRSNSFIPLPK
jgi:hypothetical protein